MMNMQDYSPSQLAEMRLENQARRERIAQRCALAFFAGCLALSVFMAGYVAGRILEVF